MSFGGFGVGLAVAELGLTAGPATGPAGRPARVAEVLPPEHRSPEEKARELSRLPGVEARLMAYKLELAVSLAADRPPPPEGPVGPGGAEEFFVEELALILGCHPLAAVDLLEHGTTLIHRLPATFAALADGRIDWPRARALATELSAEKAPTLGAAALAAIEADLLPGAGECSIRTLRAAAARQVLAYDAEAADRRRRQAERSADVTVRPVGDGMADLITRLPLPEARACAAAADGHGRAARADGDLRPLGMLRAGAVRDLVLRPWDRSRPSVTASVTVTVPVGALTPAGFLATGAPPPSAFRPAGGPAPTAEVDGQPVTAAHVRELLTRLESLGGVRAPAGGSLVYAFVDEAGALLAVATPGELERTAEGGTGAGRPSAVDRYRPSAEQYRFVDTRDRTCRHPGCDRPAGLADRDHVVPHARGGPTSCANLCCACRRHHRLKTLHPDWIYELAPDGVLTVTTPSGITRISRPPGMRPPRADDPVITRAPQPPPDPDEDPPPF